MNASGTAKRPVRAVWTEASDPGRWSGFAEALSGGRRGFVCRIVEGPSDPPGNGTEIEVSRAGGAPLLRCRVAWWDPLRGFTVTARSEGWLTGSHGTFTLRLSELDESLTSLDLSMQFVFLNRLVELSSLLLPVGFMYRRRLLRVLQLLKG
ncbi:MAG: SRPBCC family protein [Elusimicrobia bacterium]|nr:SRPBCC family protein [Elusimicrobiota bacterium]